MWQPIIESTVSQWSPSALICPDSHCSLFRLHSWDSWRETSWSSLLQCSFILVRFEEWRDHPCLGGTSGYNQALTYQETQWSWVALKRRGFSQTSGRKSHREISFRAESGTQENGGGRWVILPTLSNAVSTLKSVDHPCVLDMDKNKCGLICRMLQW